MTASAPALLAIPLMLTAFFTTASAHGADKPAEHVVYIDNGRIRLGADLSIGGAITYLADSKTRANMINSYDWGRQIQMSFYSGPPNYTKPDTRKSKGFNNFPWNPIQSGDDFDNGSRVLAHKLDGNTLYVKCVPMLWPMDNDPGECIFETWYELKDNTLLYRGRLTNARSDKTAYGAFGQELPAVYTNGPWHRVMTYVGENPFENGNLTEIGRPAPPPGEPWAVPFFPTENWAALVNDKNEGLGVWHPGCYQLSGGFAGTPRGKGGPKDFPTGYLSPTRREILDHDIVYSYDCVFIVGTVDEIRKYVYDHARRPELPVWKFETGRQHWTFVNAKDDGWRWKPEQGWRLSLTGTPARMFSPTAFWKAETAPRVRIRAAFKTKQRDARIFWKNYAEQLPSKKEHEEYRFDQKNSVAFAIQPDGQERDYIVDLSGAQAYRGAIAELMIALPASQDGDTAVVKEIALIAGKL